MNESRGYQHLVFVLSGLFSRPARSGSLLVARARPPSRSLTRSLARSRARARASRRLNRPSPRAAAPED
eukprot:30931-Pelagococcus_subviridis.AAC.3